MTPEQEPDKLEEIISFNSEGVALTYSYPKSREDGRVIKQYISQRMVEQHGDQSWWTCVVEFTDGTTDTIMEMH